MGRETKAVLPSSCNAPLVFLGGKASEVLRPRTERGSEQERSKGLETEASYRDFN